MRQTANEKAPPGPVCRERVRPDYLRQQGAGDRESAERQGRPAFRILETVALRIKEPNAIVRFE